jgi:hypothetical protein
LIAYIRNQLSTAGAPYTAINRGNNVLLAWNNVNKFGTPQNGVTYEPGQQLPYSGGAPPTAGTVLNVTAQQITDGRKTLQNRSPNTWYYFKIWVRDANGNYHEGPVAATVTDGVPRFFINEFLAFGDGPDWLEIYNPADRAVDMGNITPSFGQLRFDLLGGTVRIPANSTIPGRGYLRFIFGGTAQVNEILLETDVAIERELDEIYLRNLDGSITVDDYLFRRAQVDDVTEGRAWDGGPRGRHYGQVQQQWLSEGARFETNSTYPPTALRSVGGPSANHPAAFKHFYATPDPDQTTIYLEWQNIGVTPAVWRHSPKQHDFHPINVEGIAYRSPAEMIIGLRSPLSVDRKTGNALYFKVTNVSTPPNQFLPAGGGWAGAVSGITGPLQLNLNGQGIRSIEWCPQLGPGGAGRYLIIGGPANGGPLEKELFGETYSLYSWDGSAGPNNVATPQKLIDDLRPYTIRPEGVGVIQVAGASRVMFVEDRFQATGYGTRNAVHWPVSILGNVP